MPGEAAHSVDDLGDDGIGVPPARASMSDSEAVETNGVESPNRRPAEMNVLAEGLVVELGAELVIGVGREGREISDTDGVDPAEGEVRDCWVGRLEAVLAAQGSEEGGEGVPCLALGVFRARLEEIVRGS